VTNLDEIKPIARRRKRIALIAHDRLKQALLEWARDNRRVLAHHDLYATETTGRLLRRELAVPVTCFLSGRLGGDQQIGAAIVEGRIDLVVFFWDPLELQPHDADVKALLRVASVHNVPVACNLATAEFLLSSPLMHRDHRRQQFSFVRSVRLPPDPAPGGRQADQSRSG
jgi:methylglyoxal synthase